MKFEHFIPVAGLLCALLTGQAGWTFEPVPPPDPERIVVTREGGSFLGVGVQEIDSERAKALNLREERGVEVTRVEDESPAAKAGIKNGDVVQEYNGERIEGVEQFIRMVRETPPGREVRLSVSRNGAAHQLSVRTAPRKPWNTARFGGFQGFEIPRIHFSDLQMPDMPHPLMSWRSSLIGVEAETLDAQLAEYFGVKSGVLVRSVTPDSPADKAGLRAGDVIVKVDGAAVANPREISTALRARTGKAVACQVVRDKRELSVQITIEPK